MLSSGEYMVINNATMSFTEAEQQCELCGAHLPVFRNDQDRADAL